MNDKTISLALELFLDIIIGVKIIFLIMVITHSVVKQNTPLEKNILKWKEKVEFCYMMSMILVILFVFFPYGKNIRFLTKKMCHLMFLYGVISLITLNWSAVMQ
jgi:hypothetical protein